MTLQTGILSTETSDFLDQIIFLKSFNSLSREANRTSQKLPLFEKIAILLQNSFLSTKTVFIVTVSSCLHRNRIHNISVH